MDGPRVHEDDFDIEDDEEHGDEVEFDGEAWGSFADWQHAAFVGGVLGGVAAGGAAEDDAEGKGDGGETDGDEDLEEDWEEIGRHGEWLSAGVLAPGGWDG